MFFLLSNHQSLSLLHEAHFDDLEIPSLAYSAYNSRLPSRSSSSHPIDSMLIDLSSHWPSLTRITNLTDHNHTSSCPYSMHMLLWGPKEPLAIKILNISDLPDRYSPQPGQHILHYYHTNLTYSAINSSWISYMETDLSSGEYLFVPADSLAVFDRPDNNTDIYKLCFFDGSNMRMVRSSLITESYVSPFSKHLLKVLSSPTLFDFNMVRHPLSAFTYSVYRQHPKPNILSSGSDLASLESNEQKSSKNRRNRGKNDFRG